MWEAIAANRRRSWLLISIMGAALVGLGWLMGMSIDSEGGAWGALVALTVWFVMLLIAFAGGDGVLLLSAGGRKIEKKDHPQLFNVVEEMTIASGMAKPPDVYIIDSPDPNAFAVGRSPDKCAVGVTSGLLKKLNRDELQGVIAHEIGHIQNRDILFMTLAGVMLGAIVLLCHVFVRLVFYGGAGRGRRGKGGGGHPAILLIAVIAAILAPIIAQMLYLACSRRREYLADASSARYTRYPAGLASALRKISRSYLHSKPQHVNQALAPMYIINPGMALMAALELFSTHPPTKKRIEVLEKMVAGASFADYERAFSNVHGKTAALIGQKTLSRDAAETPIRSASAPAEAADQKKEAVERMSEVVHLLGRLENLILFTCICGVGIKIPPDLDRDSIPCPRCGHDNPVPKAEEVAAAAVAANAGAQAAGQPVNTIRYKRKGQGWESFKCSCGRAVQLSPTFSGAFVKCSDCNTRIDIET